MEERRRSLFDIVREYIEAFEEYVDQVMSRSFLERPSWDASSSSIEPLSNVEVTPSDVIITADLPFAKPDTIEVNIVGDNLVEIKAEMRRRVRFDDFGVRHFSGEFSHFHTQIRTPVCLEPRITAMDFKAGVLRVRIPRRFPRL